MSERTVTEVAGQDLRLAAKEMLDGYADKLKTLAKDYPNPTHIMRANEIGYKAQAIDYRIYSRNGQALRQAQRQGWAMVRSG